MSAVFQLGDRSKIWTISSLLSEMKGWHSLRSYYLKEVTYVLLVPFSAK